MTDLNIHKARPLAILQYLVYGGVILYFGHELFVPLCFGVLISFVLYPVCRYLERKGMRRITAVFVSVTLLLISAILIGVLLIGQLENFLQEWPQIKEKLSASRIELQNYLAQSYNVTPDTQNLWFKQLAQQSFAFIIPILKAIFSASALSLLMVILVPIYAVLLLLYRKHWVEVLGFVVTSHRKDEIRRILSLSIHAYYDFFKGMALVYLLVGVLNSAGLLLLGIPHAILFGFLVSIMTFIPYVGIIIGSLLPISFAWITYDSAWYPIGVVAIFAFVQYLEANLIFPLAISKKLHINTLSILVAIFAGGILWGVAGMILFIPFAAILKLIADHDPKLVVISKLMESPVVGRSAAGKKKQSIQPPDPVGVSGKEDARIHK